MSIYARVNRVAVDLDPDVNVRIVAPHELHDAHSDEPLLIPWVVHIGYALDLTARDRAALVTLRDALVIALAEHPVDESTASES